MYFNGKNISMARTISLEATLKFHLEIEKEYSLRPSTQALRRSIVKNRKAMGDLYVGRKNNRESDYEAASLHYLLAILAGYNDNINAYFFNPTFQTRRVTLPVFSLFHYRTCLESYFGYSKMQLHKRHPNIQELLEVQKFIVLKLEHYRPATNHKKELRMIQCFIDSREKKTDNQRSIIESALADIKDMDLLGNNPKDYRETFLETALYSLKSGCELSGLHSKIASEYGEFLVSQFLGLTFT